MGIDLSNANTTLALTPASSTNSCPPYPHTHVPAKHIPDETRVLPNNLKTQTMRSFQKVTSAFTEYPAKGLKGDKKATFYEFLSMGTVPYLVGSATFMALFNAAPKWFPNFDKKGARGDLLVVAKIMIPKVISEQERELFIKFKEISTFNPRGIN